MLRLIITLTNTEETIIARQEARRNQSTFSIFGGKISHWNMILAIAKIAPIVIINKSDTAKEAVTCSILLRSIKLLMYHTFLRIARGGRDDAPLEGVEPPNLIVRSDALYPVELQGHYSVIIPSKCHECKLVDEGGIQ